MQLAIWLRLIFGDELEGFDASFDTLSLSIAIKRAAEATRLGGKDIKASSVAHQVTKFSVFLLTFVSRLDFGVFEKF